jgi:hypothetical protein
MNKRMTQKIVIAGGSIFSCLKKMDHFETDKSADIDIFFIENGCNPEETQKILKNWFITAETLYHKKFPKNAEYVKEKFQEIASKNPNYLDSNQKEFYISEEDLKIFKGKPHEYIITRDFNSTICVCPVNQRKIQVILRRVTSIEELLVFFDLDCVRFAFDGETVFTIKEGLRSFETNQNFVSQFLNSQMYQKRDGQYFLRGIETIYVKDHPLEHLFDSPFQRKKNPNLFVFNAPILEENDVAFYTMNSWLLYSDLLEIYIRGKENYFGFSMINDERRSRISIREKFTSIISISFSELFQLTAEDFFTERYKDSHIYLKYLITRCYICGVYSQKYFQDKASMCHGCEELNFMYSKISKDLTGKTAIVTGGRVKIGFAVALKLLRSGCNVIVTTRFPTDARERFEAEKGFFYFLNS